MVTKIINHSRKFDDL